MEKLINIFTVGAILSGWYFDASAEFCSVGEPCYFTTPDTGCASSNKISSFSVTNGGKGICPSTQRFIEILGSGGASLSNDTTYTCTILSNYQFISPPNRTCRGFPGNPIMPGVSTDQNIASKNFSNSHLSFSFTTGPASGGGSFMNVDVVNPCTTCQVIFVMSCINN